MAQHCKNSLRLMSMHQVLVTQVRFLCYSQVCGRDEQWTSCPSTTSLIRIAHPLSHGLFQLKVKQAQTKDCISYSLHSHFWFRCIFLISVLHASQNGGYSMQPALIAADVTPDVKVGAATRKTLKCARLWRRKRKMNCF